MKRTLYFTLFLLATIHLVMAQEMEHYEIQGAKLGKKMARQVVEGSIERTVTVNRTETRWRTNSGDNTGNRHFTSFVGAMDGVVVGTLARNYTYQSYYHGKVGINYRKKLNNSSDISALDIANITYADEDGDGALGKDETAQIYFDLINTSDEPLYGIMPVLMADKTKHIIISDPCPIDTLKGQNALRYVIELAGDGKRNPGKVYLMLRIKYGQGQYFDIEQICLDTKRLAYKEE